MLDELDFLAECECDIHFQLVFVLVLAVAALALGSPVLGSCQRLIADYFQQVVADAVFIAEYLLGECSVLVLVFQHKFHAVVDYSLPAQDISEVIGAYIYIREHLKVRFPVYLCAGGAVAAGLLEPALVLGDIEALFKAQGVIPLPSVALNFHIFACELRRAQTKTVESQGKGVVSPGIVVVLASRIQRAECKLPVVLILSLVEIYRYTASIVLDGYGLIGVQRDDYALSVALARLVDGVRDYLKNRVTAAVHAVRTEDNARTQAHLVRTFQRHKVVVIVFLWHLCISCLPQ